MNRTSPILAAAFLMACGATLDAQSAATEHVRECTGQTIDTTNLSDADADRLLMTSCEQLSDTKSDSIITQLLCRYIDCEDDEWFRDKPVYTEVSAAAQASGFSPIELTVTHEKQVTGFQHASYIYAENVTFYLSEAHILHQHDEDASRCAHAVIQYVDSRYLGQSRDSKLAYAAYFGEGSCDEPSPVDSLERLSYDASDHFIETQWLSAAPWDLGTLRADLRIRGIDGGILFIRSPKTESAAKWFISTEWAGGTRNSGFYSGTMDFIVQIPLSERCTRVSVEFNTDFDTRELSGWKAGEGSCDPLDTTAIMMTDLDR